MKLSYKTQNILLTTLNCGLTMVSVGLAIHDTVKAMDVISEMKQELAVEDKELSKKDMVKGTVKCYIPTIIATSLAVGTTIAVGARNSRIQAFLASSAALYMTQYERYRKHAIEELGEEKDKEIIDKVAEDQYILQKEKIAREKTNVDDTLFFDDHSGRFFWSNKEDVLSAEYELNRYYSLNGEAELGIFYQGLGLAPTPLSQYIGWEPYAGEVYYGYRWVDFEHFKKKLDNGQEYYVIHFTFKPHALDEYCEEKIKELGYDVNEIGLSAETAMEG